MRFYQTILGYPKTVIAIILAVTLFFGWQAGKSETDWLRHPFLRTSTET